LWLIEREVKAGWTLGKLFFAYFFLALNIESLAQDPNNNYCIDRQGAATGGFTLSKTKICAGEAVSVTGGIPTGLSNIGYIAPYDGKGIPSNVVSGANIQFTGPGSYTVLQVGAINGLRALACREVTVLPLDPIKFTAKACSGRNVFVDVTLDASTSQYDSYIINWGDGQNSAELTQAEIRTQQTHEYANTGLYSIRITGRYAAPASCETPTTTSQRTLQSVTITAATATPAITKLTTVDDKTISIEYLAGAGVGVELLQKDASGVFGSIGKRATGPGTFSVQTNAKEQQCFQLVTQDACNSEGQRSDEVCSLVISASAGNKKNEVIWKPYDGTVSATSQFRRYRIARNGSPLITYFQQGVGNHEDINKIECGTQYCYTLEATIAGSVETVVTSAPVCVTGVNGDVPESFGDIIVSIESNHPRLVATLPIVGASSSYTLAISRADGPSGSFQPVATVENKNTYVDQAADATKGSYCYQFTYLTNCGLSSPPSAPVCSIFLGAPSSRGLEWTASSPFTPGTVTNYIVEVIDSLSGTKQEIQVGGNLRYEPSDIDPRVQAQTYRILAVSSNGQVSYSNFYTLLREATVFVPDAFTPNGDGTNDEFTAKGVYADKFSMSVYNRWGEVVYASSDKTKGWDGTAGGQQLPAGQYMYRIEVQDVSGRKTVRSGAVLLIR
jgi:gliding motility-associated-like protein